MVAVSRKIDQRSTPERALDMSAKVKASDDAEIVTATTQSPVEVRIRSPVHINDDTRCEDKFVIDDVVTCPAIFLREE